MSQTNPIPRTTRGPVDLPATAGQTVFPFPFWLYDDEDVEVRRRLVGETEFSAPLALGVQYTVTNLDVTGGANVVMAAGQAAGTVIRLLGLRVPTRTTSVVQGGVVRSGPLERELDLLNTTQQELRRDIDDVDDRLVPLEPLFVQAVRSPVDEPTQYLPTRSSLRDRLVGGSGSGNLLPVSLPLIQLGARGEFANRVTFAATALLATTLVAFLLGYGSPGDQGDVVVRRVDSEPSHPGKIRSADFFTSTGAVDVVNGGWWAYVTTGQVRPEQLGAIVGVADHGPPLRDAIAYLEARGCGTLQCSAADYTVQSGSIAIVNDAITIRGVAVGGRAGVGTNFIFANGANDCFKAGSPAAGLSGFRLHDVRITTTGKTDGWTINIERCIDVLISGIKGQDWHKGVRVMSSNNVIWENSQVQRLLGGAAVFWGGTPTARSDVLQLRNLSVLCQDALGNSQNGIVWDGSAHTMVIDSVRMLGAGRGIWIRNTLGNAGSFPSFLEAFAFEKDAGPGASVYIECGRDFRFVNCDLFFSTNDHAVVVEADLASSITSGVIFDSCRIGNAFGCGIYFDARDLSVVGCTIASNSQAGSGIWDGIQLGPECQDVRIIGNSLGAAWGNLTLHGYGVKIDAGAQNIVVIGNDCTDVVHDDVLIGTTAPTVISHSNYGANSSNSHYFGANPRFRSKAGWASVEGDTVRFWAAGSERVRVKPNALRFIPTTTGPAGDYEEGDLWFDGIAGKHRAKSNGVIVDLY